MNLLKALCLLPTAVLGLYLPWLAIQNLIPLPPALSGSDVKVPVQLGVMSRCPDALHCESVFNDVLKKVADKVSLSLIYIAKFDLSEPEFGVKCMHGREECAGNAQQLCVAKYETPQTWWNFVQCQNRAGRYRVGDADLALKCAKEAGFDWEYGKAGQCAGEDGSGTGAEGIALLRNSVAAAQRMGVQTSCTIIINGRKVCIHDGTWKECKDGHSVDDFVHQINEEYNRLNGDSA